MKLWRIPSLSLPPPPLHHPSKTEKTISMRLPYLHKTWTFYMVAIPKIIQTTPKPHCLYTSPVPPPPSWRPGAWGCCLGRCQVSLGLPGVTGLAICRCWLAGWARRRPSRSPPPPPPHQGDATQSPSPPGALGCSAGRQRCGWTWAAPGWIRGWRATDSCPWPLLCCFPTLPLAIAAVEEGLFSFLFFFFLNFIFNFRKYNNITINGRHHSIVYKTQTYTGITIVQKDNNIPFTKY